MQPEVANPNHVWQVPSNLETRASAEYCARYGEEMTTRSDLYSDKKLLKLRALLFIGMLVVSPDLSEVEKVERSQAQVPIV